MYALSVKSKELKKKRGFTLIEVVAAAALIGTMVTMVTPAVSGANNKVKNAKLANDLATIDQAIQMYRFDHNKLPEKLSDLNGQYLGGTYDFKDCSADGTIQLVAVGSDGSYKLYGTNTSNEVVYSNGSVKDTTNTQNNEG